MIQNSLKHLSICLFHFLTPVNLEIWLHLKKLLDQITQIYIIIDLIKLFVESHRNYFKVKIMEIYK